VIQSRMKRALFTAAIVLGMPTMLVAQEADHQTAVPDQEELEAIFAELQQVHLQLEEIQMQALQDPQLSAAQEQLGEEIRQAMESHDPTMKDRMARVQALETEAANAHQAGDHDRLQLLMTEAQQLEEHFMAVQHHVLEEPAIATKVTAFQTQLERKMVEVDPDAQTLITRFRELEGRLQAAMRAGA
jgi:cell fate (sporulation/competence/biofilm development) regulator YlbF (YheA/YmcA/DUF963 family)